MRRAKQYGWLSGLGLALLLGITLVLPPAVQALPPLQFSATPAPVILPSISPTAIMQFTATPTRTPTPIGPALVEALEGPTNVRAAPDIESERLGQIFPGEFYPVLGRAAGTLWYKIQYPDSPTGTAWVFEQVVRITGNVDAIEEIQVLTQPTVDVNAAISTQTLEALAQMPGGLETATALAFAANAMVMQGTLPPTETPAPKPTFTYPPEPISQATLVIPPAATTQAASTGLPPIIPILALGAVGGLGMLIGILRRLGR